MIFLIPFLLIIAIIFGIDYIYFKDQNASIQSKIEQVDLNSSLEKEKRQYIKNLFKIQ
ncbi:hypothetical protein N4T57_04990 [Campylobacter hepaticus]|uniref:hypothetical protein n=1 Tax=Campylobacter hepaticus TaxID=1813019 RepID=UPI0013C3783D|nr:hypothetical protein [Campylobacter hepaticus]MCZ0772502.1 hypothetical protein [Campylobacter hepaticus]MCZ0773970.1 hypothetical protein [Campylobacter hepaticus]MCZ0775222.1 hypothetical protein [Campylobacter hepaticus]MDX2323277.1 hypothetical protein [Campylobacter hepaticus]MDX2331122.1 hypothetical protein [Campylobacter hepaticus]